MHPSDINSGHQPIDAMLQQGHSMAMLAQSSSGHNMLPFQGSRGHMEPDADDPLDMDDACSMGARGSSAASSRSSSSGGCSSDEEGPCSSAAVERMHGQAAPSSMMQVDMPRTDGMARVERVAPRQLSLDDLRRVFHLSRKAAAAALGIAVNSLKKACRRNGIDRWPCRKLISLDNLQRSAQRLHGHDGQLAESIQAEMQRVVENPNHRIDRSLAVLRTQTYKQAYAKKLRQGNAGPHQAAVGSPSPAPTAASPLMNAAPSRGGSSSARMQTDGSSGGGQMAVAAAVGAPIGAPVSSGSSVPQPPAAGVTAVIESRPRRLSNLSPRPRLLGMRSCPPRSSTSLQQQWGEAAAGARAAQHNPWQIQPGEVVSGPPALTGSLPASTPVGPQQWGEAAAGARTTQVNPWQVQPGQVVSGPPALTGMMAGAAAQRSDALLASHSNARRHSGLSPLSEGARLVPLSSIWAAEQRGQEATGMHVGDSAQPSVAAAAAAACGADLQQMRCSTSFSSVQRSTGSSSTGQQERQLVALAPAAGPAAMAASLLRAGIPGGLTFDSLPSMRTSSLPLELSGQLRPGSDCIPLLRAGGPLTANSLPGMFTGPTASIMPGAHPGLGSNSLPGPQAGLMNTDPTDLLHRRAAAGAEFHGASLLLPGGQTVMGLQQARSRDRALSAQLGPSGPGTRMTLQADKSVTLPLGRDDDEFDWEEWLTNMSDAAWQQHRAHEDAVVVGWRQRQQRLARQLLQPSQQPPPPQQQQHRQPLYGQQQHQPMLAGTGSMGVAGSAQQHLLQQQQQRAGGQAAFMMHDPGGRPQAPHSFLFNGSTPAAAAQAAPLRPAPAPAADAAGGSQLLPGSCFNRTYPPLLTPPAAAAAPEAAALAAAGAGVWPAPPQGSFMFDGPFQ